jgi:hypothetical protein
VGTQVTPRDLCIQHGCARLEGAVKAALAAYKDRFVRRLPAAQQGHVDFGRPVFLATAFYLVARKNKMQVRVGCGCGCGVCMSREGRGPKDGGAHGRCPRWGQPS